jgi:hypothetical protein
MFPPEPANAEKENQAGLSPRVLLHVGYHKTGTTWLQHYLFKNPACRFMAPFTKKEIHRWLVIPNALVFSALSCREHFYSLLIEANAQSLTPVLSAERLSGSLHAGGYDSQELAGRLAKVFPDARVLLVIREQKSMLLSSYNQYVKAGGPCALAEYLRPPVSQRPVLVPLFDLDRFQYHRLIAHYLDLFGAANVLVLPFERFQARPRDFVRQIARFCEREIPDEALNGLPYQARPNPSLSSFALAVKRRLNPLVVKPGPLNPWVLCPLPGLNHLRWKEAFYRFDAILPRPLGTVFDQRMRSTVAAIVGDRYAQSNRLTSEMLNLDLAQYGYDVAP